MSDHWFLRRRGTISASGYHEPIAITGMGIVLPGTRTVADFWRHLSGGNSQIRRITRFDPVAEQLPVYAAAELDKFDHRQFLPKLSSRHAEKYSREILAVMSAVALAKIDAELDDTDVNPRKVSLVQSTSRGSLEWWFDATRNDARGPSSAAGHMAGALGGLAGNAASMAGIYIGAQGLVTTITNGCVGGHHALGLALHELRSGDSDIVYVGGHEFPITPEILRWMITLGPSAVSGERSCPARAIRPYNIDRTGMVLGEGAVTLCLERASTARARGATAYAHVFSHRALNEAGHATSMDPTGRLPAQLVREAVHAAGCSVDDVGYYCGHGTGTRINDAAESRMLKTLYPGRRSDQLPPIGSNKPIFGHTLGMAGTINVAATALMLHHQQLAPTANITEVDPECDHDHVVGGPRDADLQLAVSLTFGIGSQMSAAVLGRAS